jgi:hypothetical protein
MVSPTSRFSGIYIHPLSVPGSPLESTLFALSLICAPVMNVSRFEGES